MRFVDTTTFEFHEVSELELDKLEYGYSILSHRWMFGDGEIMFADVLSMDSDVKAKAGYPKFAGACTLAKKLNYDFLWIDTCCINRTDSVELGEAINSMYRWYARAKLCIVYLQDVDSLGHIPESNWFTRGWTLQELIAPRTIHFYNRAWTLLGDKANLSSVLAKRTGIPADVLNNKRPAQAYSLAQRMSWAAKRATTRVEDRAYSLMGLFNVNMPMIYGEREQAFIRLQEQIISKSADESIFVWNLDLLEDSTRDAKQVLCGLLATSPTCFADCGDVISNGRSRGFHISQFGLSISLPATQHAFGTYLAPLNVTKAEAAGQCAILLTKLREENAFARISSESGMSVLMTTTSANKLMEFNVSLQPTETPFDIYPGFWLRNLSFCDSRIRSHTTITRRHTDETAMKLPDGEFGTAGVIRLELQNSGQPAGAGWIKLGFDRASHPICFVTFPGEEDNDPSTKSLPAQAEHWEMLVNNNQWSPERPKHPIFNDNWTHASSEMIARLPPYSYDSRLSTTEVDNGFDFTFQAHFFEIKIAAQKVPRMSTSSRKSEMWAIDIVAGTKPVPRPYYRHDSRCC